LRGIAAHHAAAELLRATTTRADLEALDGAARRQRIGAAAAQALAPLFGAVGSQLALIRRLEHDRLTRALDALVDAEVERGDFEVVACETKAVIGLGQSEIRARLDRVDRLASGGLAVIDYKTGQATGVPEWFGVILSDAQVPAYATHIGAELSAAVLCSLRPDAVRYRGLWRAGDEFPGAPLPLPAPLDWPGLHFYWLERLGELAREFAAGDVRVRLEGARYLRGMLAPLTRIYELRAMPDTDESA
jgi:ATP-dependent helicase/nuclease subunit B